MTAESAAAAASFCHVFIMQSSLDANVLLACQLLELRLLWLKSRFCTSRPWRRCAKKRIEAERNNHESAQRLQFKTSVNVRCRVHLELGSVLSLVGCVRAPVDPLVRFTAPGRDV